jgi:hypothetical protein
MNLFVFNQKVNKPKYKIGEVVTVGFKESYVDKNDRLYLAKILDINKKNEINNNEYFEYKIEILIHKTNKINFNRVTKHHKQKGEVHTCNESMIY